MNRKEIIKSAKGVTIVELLIALSLLGMVLGVAYSIHSFGVNIFTRGESKAALQQDVRFVGRILSKEIRYAHEVRILDNHAQGPNNGFYIYVDHGNVVKRTGSGENMNLTNEPYSPGGWELTFARNKDNAQIVDVTIRANAGSEVFEIESSILALNVTAVDASSGSGTVLWYRGL